jgi:hypothetical protein
MSWVRPNECEMSEVWLYRHRCRAPGHRNRPSRAQGCFPASYGVVNTLKLDRRRLKRTFAYPPSPILMLANGPKKPRLYDL